MLKGNSTIELTNVKTKEKEVYKKENLITNAVPDLLRLNPSGLMYPIDQYKSVQFKEELFPTANKCYGGLLLFENPLEENVDKIVAPADNPITGFSSNNVNSSDAPKRGSANLTESGPIENGYKFVWDFSTSQGNGKISSLALTHYRGGRQFYGNTYGKDNSSLRLNYVYEPVTIEIARVYVGMVEADIVGNTITSLWPKEDRTLEIVTMSEAISSIGLNDPLATNRPQTLEKITLNIEEFYKDIRYWYDCDFFDGKDGYWYGFVCNSNRSGNARLNRVKIKKDDFSTTFDTWILEDVQLYQIGYLPSRDTYFPRKTKYSVLEEGYLYTINNEYDALYKININNPVDVSKIPLGFKSAYTSGQSVVSYLYEWGDYIVANDFVYNSRTDEIIPTKGYNIPDVSTPYIEIGPFRLAYGSYTGSSNPMIYKNLYLHTPYLGTINNLSTPILKTADKTMKITYTLTEVEGNL